MILLLTEAGSGIGFGHLTRMLALGEALMEAGKDVVMLVQWEGPPDQRITEGRAWVKEGNWRDDPVAASRKSMASAALVDSYRLPLSGYESIAGTKAKLLVIDDFYRLPYPADLVINPNVYADPQRYLPAARKARGGVDCVILRPDFVKAAGSFKVGSDLQRVLVTLGGSDAHETGRLLASALADSGLETDWIAPDHQADAFSHPRLAIHGTVGASDFIELVRRNDLVICGGGQTLHELACLGAPCVALELGDDQRLNLGFYEQAGSLDQRLVWSQPQLAEAVLGRVDSLRAESERQRLSALGRSLINGRGAHHVASEILDGI